MFSPEELVCPAGEPYFSKFSMSTLPNCKTHKIDGAEIIASKLLKTPKYNYEDNIHMTNPSNPSGVRRYAFYQFQERDVIRHSNEVSAVLFKALNDTDEIVRMIAADTIKTLKLLPVGSTNSSEKK